MKRRSRKNRRLLTITALAVLAIIILILWRRLIPGETRKPSQGEAGKETKKEPPKITPLGTASTPPTQKPPAAAISGTEAGALFDSGMAALSVDRLVEARSKLSKAYLSGALSGQKQDELREILTELADITLIGPRSTVYSGDPYAFYYEFRPGEVLVKVERKLNLHVPWELILRVNGIERPEDIQADRPYKMIYGPFHAIISKSDFTMDIYLRRDRLEPVFIKRMRVGTGKNGATPTGMWRVRLGGKNRRATWYPPPNSPIRQPVPYGEPNYAFGRKGLWIGLEGLEENTRLLWDHGIHSTNDPESIGRAESLGCIRLADDDIELVYTLLYEHWSTVEVRP